MNIKLYKIFKEIQFLIVLLIYFLYLQNFQFFSDVIPCCKAEELLLVPAGEHVSLVATLPRYGILLTAQGGSLQG